MSSQYPRFDVYHDLYARYFDGRDVSELLDLLQPLEDTHLLDLCGGEGRLSLKALERGAEKVTLVDSAAAMISPIAADTMRIHVQVKTVSDALAAMYAQDLTVDRIACRQAVNYWLDEPTAELLAQVLSPQGIFAFNTFNQKPSEKPRVMEYELNGHSFMEASLLVGDVVHHVQMRDGLAAHLTSFRWISSERFHALLEPYFTVSEEARGKASLYRCVRK